MYEMSIIVLCYNKWAFTKACLDDLSALDRTRVELIVVNNASTDETHDRLSEYKEKISNLTIIDNTKNLGFGVACNQAYVQAQGDYVMFLNNDIRVKENKTEWATDLTKYCNDNNIVGPTGGKVDIKNEFQFLYETSDPTKDINYLSGWCIVAKKSVWSKLIDDFNCYKGPFCEAFFVYFEDTHLSFSATKLGIKLQMIPIPVVHFGKVSSKQLNTHSLYINSKKIFNQIWKNK